jgi:hypothetical protein
MNDQKQLKNMLLVMKKNLETTEKRKTENVKNICNLLNSVDGKF